MTVYYTGSDLIISTRRKVSQRETVVAFLLGVIKL